MRLLPAGGGRTSSICTGQGRGGVGGVLSKVSQTRAFTLTTLSVVCTCVCVYMCVCMYMRIRTGGPNASVYLDDTVVSGDVR